MQETKGSLLATVRSDDVMLIRRKHRVGFGTQHTVADIVQLLKTLPQHATLDEWIDWDEFGVVTLEFHEESVTR